MSACTMHITEQKQKSIKLDNMEQETEKKHLIYLFYFPQTDTHT